MTADGNENRRRRDGRLHKAYLTAIGLLWSALIAVSSFALGARAPSRIIGAELRAHETGGHPVVQTQLQSIQQQLREIKIDVREIRLVIGGVGD